MGDGRAETWPRSRRCVRSQRGICLDRFQSSRAQPGRPPWEGPRPRPRTEVGSPRHRDRRRCPGPLPRCLVHAVRWIHRRAGRPDPHDPVQANRTERSERPRNRRKHGDSWREPRRAPREWSGRAQHELLRKRGVLVHEGPGVRRSNDPDEGRINLLGLRSRSGLRGSAGGTARVHLRPRDAADEGRTADHLVRHQRGDRVLLGHRRRGHARSHGLGSEQRVPDRTGLEDSERRERGSVLARILPVHPSQPPGGGSEQSTRDPPPNLDRGQQLADGDGVQLLESEPVRVLEPVRSDGLLGGPIQHVPRADPRPERDPSEQPDVRHDESAVPAQPGIDPSHRPAVRQLADDRDVGSLERGRFLLESDRRHQLLPDVGRPSHLGRGAVQPPPPDHGRLREQPVHRGLPRLGVAALLRLQRHPGPPGREPAHVRTVHRPDVHRHQQRLERRAGNAALPVRIRLLAVPEPGGKPAVLRLLAVLHGAAHDPGCRRPRPDGLPGQRERGVLRLPVHRHAPVLSARGVVRVLPREPDRGQRGFV